MTRPAYSILHREAPRDESHGWTPVATPHTLGEARDILASPTWEPAQGDLVRVVGAKRDDLFVYDSDGSSFRRAPKPFTLAWWEGADADAAAMLRACEHVDRRRFVLASCACARTVLHFVPKGEDRPRVAIETAERWARGEATLNKVRTACAAAWDAYSTIPASASASAAASAAAAAASVSVYATASALYATASALYATANASVDATAYAASSAAATAAAVRALAPLIRAHIPLSVTVCAALGLRDPLRLQFDAEVAA